MHRPRILVADSRRPFLQLCRALLEQRYDVVGTVGDGLGLLTIARELKPDVIITNVNLKFLYGIEASRRLSQFLPDARVLLLTTEADSAELDSALKAGARGYLLTSCPPAELCRAIDEVLRGRIYVTPLLTDRESTPQVEE